MAEYGAEKKVSKYSSVFAAVSIGIPTGVILKLKIVRSNQTYVFPLHLSEEIIPAAVFYATVTPIIGWFVIKKTIIDPMNDDKAKYELERTQRENEEKLAERKKEAQIAVNLMQHTYERLVAEERERGGLIILKAIYSSVDDDNGTSDATNLDVTIPVQCLVKDGRLMLYAASKSELPGFYDINFGKPKKLKLDYQIRNEFKSVCIKDTEALHIPA